jgi:hypothetical protein
MYSNRSGFIFSLSVALCTGLGGCFFTLESKVPLLTGENADFPFTNLVMESDKKGSPDIMVRDGDSYKITAGEGSLPVLLKQVSGDTFIAQVTFQTNPKIGYAIYKYDQRQSEISDFFCGNYSAETLASLKIEIRHIPHIANQVCDFKSLSQLIALSAKPADGPDPVKKGKVISIEK